MLIFATGYDGLTGAMMAFDVAGRRGRALLDDAAFHDKPARIEIELIALEALGLRLLADAGRDSGVLGSMSKIRWSELLQRATELWAETLGYDAEHFRAPDHRRVSGLIL